MAGPGSCERPGRSPVLAVAGRSEAVGACRHAFPAKDAGQDPRVLSYAGLRTGRTGLTGFTCDWVNN